MLDYLAAIGVGTLVFLVFMLVFMKRDSRGRRGGRLAGCQHRQEDRQGCDRCRDTAPASIRPHPPGQNND